MKLIDVLLLSFAAAVFIIAIHQIMTVGFGSAYWLVMVSTALFFMYSYRKGKRKQ